MKRTAATQDKAGSADRGAGRQGTKSAGGATLGTALRAVYQDAIGESVPDEMLDLLNQLK